MDSVDIFGFAIAYLFSRNCPVEVGLEALKCFSVFGYCKDVTHVYGPKYSVNDCTCRQEPDNFGGEKEQKE
jgi:hypothetical protein